MSITDIALQVTLLQQIDKKEVVQNEQTNMEENVTGEQLSHIISKFGKLTASPLVIMKQTMKIPSFIRNVRYKNHNRESLMVIEGNFYPKSDDILFIENKMVVKCKGLLWNDYENHNIIIKNNNIHNTDNKIVIISRKIEPTHIISGITSGIHQVGIGTLESLNGIKDLVVDPIQGYINSDENNKEDGLKQGIKKGTKSFMIGNRNLLLLSISGAQKYIEGIFNTPQAIVNMKKGLRYNPFIGWTHAYLIKDLNKFPGKVGDMLCIHVGGGIYCHCMLKKDDLHVIHRTGSVVIDKKSKTKVKIKMGVIEQTLDDIKKEYYNNYITVEDSNYCVIIIDKKQIGNDTNMNYDQNQINNNEFIRNDECKNENNEEKDGINNKILSTSTISSYKEIYRAYSRDEIISRIEKLDEKMVKGWNLFDKNCEHFCLWARFGLHFSSQLEQFRIPNYHNPNHF